MLVALVYGHSSTVLSIATLVQPHNPGNRQGDCLFSRQYQCGLDYSKSCQGVGDEPLVPATKYRNTGLFVAHLTAVASFHFELFNALGCPIVLTVAIQRL
jgi:hypothetical protein